MTDRGHPAVSVLTPVYNEEAVIARTVRSMLAQRDPGGGIEFLFVEGRSEDGTRSILEAFAAEDPRVRVLDNPLRVTSAALNVGLASARGEYVARMDAHALYPRDYLALGVARVRRGDVIHASGPAVAVGVDPWSRRIAAALGTRLGIGGAGFRLVGDREREVASGFTGVWRRETLVDAGGWLEACDPNEDAELAARLRRRGGIIVCLPEMAAEYLPRKSLGALARQYHAYGRARARTAGLHPNALGLSHLLPPALVATVAAAAGPSSRGRRLGRALLGGYLVAVGASAATARVEARRDRLALPLVYATMHGSWGAGFLRTCVTEGPPTGAIAAALTRRLRPA